MTVVGLGNLILCGSHVLDNVNVMLDTHTTLSPLKFCCWHKSLSPEWTNIILRHQTLCRSDTVLVQQGLSWTSLPWALNYLRSKREWSILLSPIYMSWWTFRIYVCQDESSHAVAQVAIGKSDSASFELYGVTSQIVRYNLAPHNCYHKQPNQRGYPSQQYFETFLYF